MISLNSIKLVAGLVASTTAGTVVTHAIKATTPENLSFAKKGSVLVGGFIISAMVGDQAEKFVSRNIDVTAAQFVQAREDIKKARAGVVDGEVVKENPEA